MRPEGWGVQRAKPCAVRVEWDQPSRQTPASRRAGSGRGRSGFGVSLHLWALAWSPEQLLEQACSALWTKGSRRKCISRAAILDGVLWPPPMVHPVGCLVFCLFSFNSIWFVPMAWVYALCYKLQVCESLQDT